MHADKPLFRIAMLAGAAGGAAELLWVAAYGSVTPVNGMQVASEVTTSVLADAAPAALAPLLGIGIHMLLSVALGLLLAGPLLRWVVPHHGSTALMPAALAALSAVWALNFLVVLPVLNPAFVALIPLSATLVSKLLFGAAMGWTLKRAVDSGRLQTRVPARFRIF